MKKEEVTALKRSDQMVDVTMKPRSLVLVRDLVWAQRLGKSSDISPLESQNSIKQ